MLQLVWHHYYQFWKLHRAVILNYNGYHWQWKIVYFHEVFFCFQYEDGLATLSFFHRWFMTYIYISDWNILEWQGCPHIFLDHFLVEIQWIGPWCVTNNGYRDNYPVLLPEIRKFSSIHGIAIVLEHKIDRNGGSLEFLFWRI